ncbi:pheromone A receptor-domain-containing protein [Cerioporus squamosus]|nr:pheromone A receptor-domain-containing protein [Cerioporus squamosus]
MDPTYPLFPVFAFLGFILALVPLPWHFQAWNAGTCIYMVWASLASLIQFVDSIIWRGNIINSAPIWCDISTKFLIGAGVGIPAASACISRRLYKIASTSYVTTSVRERRKAIYIDLSIGVGIPVIVMVLHYVVQGHRFNILEDIGCVPTIYNTPPAYPLVYMWPPLLALVSFVYSGLTLRAFWVRRMQFRDVISKSSSMTVSRYFRLLLLACIDMTCNVPLTVLNMWINNDGVQMDPWVSWANTHYQFWHVEQIPGFVWRANRAFTVSAELGRWIFPICAIIFFLLFGFAEEARRNYSTLFWTVAKRFGLAKPEPRSSKQAIPSFVRASDNSKSVEQEPLPPYTLPVYFKRPKSNGSDMLQDVLDVNLDKMAMSPISPTDTTTTLSIYDTYATPIEHAFPFDSEKGLPLQSIPSTPTSPSASSSLSYDDGDAAHIVISEEHPPSRPPTPPLVVGTVAHAVPSYHRPFSPPTVFPIGSPMALPDDPEMRGSITVTVRTETH